MKPALKSLRMVLFAGVLVGAPSAALAVVLDFENLPGMPVGPGSPIPASSQLSVQFLATVGVVFSSGSDFVPVVALGAGHATSGVNGIAGSTPDGRQWYERTYPIVARFYNPLSPIEVAVTDFVSVRSDLRGTSGMTTTLNAYDQDGVLVGSDTKPDTGGQLHSISAPGIHSVEFFGSVNNNGVALDDFTFNPVTPIAVLVAPTSWGRIKALYY